MAKDEKITALAVYVKYPEPGKVKTRLAEEIGAERATSFYERMVAAVLEHTVLPLDRHRFEPVLLCDPFQPVERYRERFPGFPCEAQSIGDLGVRLTRAFESLLSRYGAAIAIGTDCLDISPSLLEKTVELLGRDTDLVLGPAMDGGYYLIGMKKLRPSLFQEIQWSTDTVLETTLEKAGALGLRTHLLPELRDIDTLADLKAAGWHL